jgi:ribose transport system permease protein
MLIIHLVRFGVNDSLRRFLGMARGREFGIIISLIIMVIMFTVINPIFLKSDNLESILRASAFTGIMAVGVGWLLISGSIDLSIGAVAGMGSIVTSYLIVKLGYPISISILVGLASGLTMGILNYMLIFLVKIPAFLATIGTMYIARGMAYFISNGFSIYPLPKVVGDFGMATPLNTSWHFIIFVLLIIISQIILFRTVYGLEVRATGSDREIAKMTEVNVKKVNISTFIIAGTLSALSGILLMTRVITGQPSTGTGWELIAISACAIGGVSLFGYEGSFLGVFLGVIALQVIQNGLVVMGLSSHLNLIVIGIILVCTAAIDWQRRIKLDI